MPKTVLSINRLLKNSFFSQTHPWTNKSKILSAGLPGADRPNKLPASTSFITFVLVVSAFKWQWYLKVNFTNLRFFRSTLRSAVKAVSPKGAETKQLWQQAKRRAKLGNKLGKGNIHQSFSTSCIYYSDGEKRLSEIPAKAEKIERILGLNLFPKRS